MLPGDLTIFDIDWFSVYDVVNKQNLGSVIIPDEPNVPPSLAKIAVCLPNAIVTTFSSDCLLSAFIFYFSLTSPLFLIAFNFIEICKPAGKFSDLRLPFSWLDLLVIHCV